MHRSSPRNGRFANGSQHLIAGCCLVLLCLWVIHDLGGFDLTGTVRVDEAISVVPGTFAKVDHPFHATRAATLLESLQQGDLLRWIGNHQGGYPVEFYPLGIAWLDVGVWVMLLGQVPIIAVHKLTVLLIFVLPAAAYWILARGDRLNPWTAFLATAIHISVPGDWTNGGYRELVDWGLVTNVGGATLALIACAALAWSVRDGHRFMTVLASLSITAAAYTNPRSLPAVALTAASVLATSAFFDDPERPTRIWTSLLRLSAIAATASLLAAPLLIPLVRYRDLYYFVHYEGYATLREYWDSTITAVSLPVLLVSIAGLILTFAIKRHFIARSFAIALVAYVFATGAWSNLGLQGGVIDQLETPRLMPFQRLVMIYLAAYFAALVIERMSNAMRKERSVAMSSAAMGVAGIAIIVVMSGSFWTLPDVFARPPTETTLRPEFQAYRTAVEVADDVAPDGTAILVIGNQLDSRNWWHEQLWGPVESDAPFFYDDWLWYWHQDHDGPYNYVNGHFYPDPGRALSMEYFRSHGIGAVVVTGAPVREDLDARESASTNPDLALERTIGEWDVYRIVSPSSIVTNGIDQPTSLTIDDGEIEATFPSASGVVEIRRNWFPRWTAWADGQDIPVERTDNGYMQVTVPEGTKSLVLRYGVTNADWFARWGVVVGVAGLVALAMPVKTRGPIHASPQSRDRGDRS